MRWLSALVVVLALGCAGSVEAPPPPVEPEPVPVVQPEPLPDPTDEKLAATHILITYDGAVGSTASRSKDEAKALAEELLEGATPVSLPELAREHSDDPTGRRGGRLGVWRTGRMALEFERCVAAAGVGELGPLCETPFGFHIVRRDPVDEASGEQVTVRFAEGDEQAAKAKIEAIRAAVTEGRALGAVASEQGAERVVLEEVARGQLVPDVEAALFALEAGAVSEPIATPNAWHLVQRH